MDGRTGVDWSLERHILPHCIYQRLFPMFIPLEDDIMLRSIINGQFMGWPEQTFFSGGFLPT